MKKGKSAKVEIIGAVLKVTDAKNPSLIGITGTVADETRNTITVQTGQDTKKLVKDQITIEINGKPIISNISGRIEERIKG
ncbi:MAG: ribonuclease P protein subunit [Candidatus Woesearchaeota archaeon]